MSFKALSVALLLATAHVALASEVINPTISEAVSSGKNLDATGLPSAMQEVQKKLETSKKPGEEILVFYMKDGKFFDHTGQEIVNIDAPLDTKGTKTSKVLADLDAAAKPEGGHIEYLKKCDIDPTKDKKKKATVFEVLGKDGKKLYNIVVKVFVIEPEAEAPKPEEKKVEQHTAPVEAPKPTEPAAETVKSGEHAAPTPEAHNPEEKK